MLKKTLTIFLSLLVSSFLVISCSNNDVTGATGTGLPQQYRFKVYTGVLSDGSVNYNTTIRTTDKGSVEIEIGSNSPFIIPEGYIFDKGNGVYSGSYEGASFNFIFSEQSLDIDFSKDGKRYVGVFSI